MSEQYFFVRKLGLKELASLSLVVTEVSRGCGMRWWRQEVGLQPFTLATGYGTSYITPVIVSQVFAIVLFLCHYVIPVSIFVYCYGRIFYVIRRQSKVVSGHTGRGQGVTTATTSRDQNTGHAENQQQATGTTTGAKLSRI